MRLSRIIASAVTALATAGALALAGTPAPAAQPAPYPPQPPTLSVSDPTVPVGETFTLTGAGFTPGEEIRLSFTYQPLAARAPGAAPDRQLGGGIGAMAPVAQLVLPDRADPANPTIVRGDAEGRISVQLKFDRQAEVVITATGLTSGLTGSVTVTIFAPQSQEPSPSPSVSQQPPLPVTGSSIVRQLGVGTGLLVAGVLMVLLAIAWHRRTRRPAPEHGPL